MKMTILTLTTLTTFGTSVSVTHLDVYEIYLHYNIQMKRCRNQLINCNNFQVYS